MINCFEPFDSLPPQRPIISFLYVICNIKLQLYAKELAWSRGVGKHFKKTFSFSYMFNSKNRVLNLYQNRYLSNEKSIFVDNSRAEPTILSIEKVTFLEKLFSVHFMGNSSLRLSEVRCKNGSENPI